MSDSIKTQLNRIRPAHKTNPFNLRMLSVLSGQLPCFVDGKDDPGSRIETSRHIILSWANTRWGGYIPQSAFDGETFEALPAHNIFIGACSLEAPKLWAARFHHHDAEVPARGWTVGVNVAEIGSAVIFGYSQ